MELSEGEDFAGDDGDRMHLTDSEAQPSNDQDRMQLTDSEAQSSATEDEPTANAEKKASPQKIPRTPQHDRRPPILNHKPPAADSDTDSDDLREKYNRLKAEIAATKASLLKSPSKPPRKSLNGTLGNLPKTPAAPADDVVDLSDIEMEEEADAGADGDTEMGENDEDSEYQDDETMVGPNFEAAGLPARKGTRARVADLKYSGDTQLSIRRNAPRESIKQARIRRETEATDPILMPWEDTHLIRLLPERYHVMVAPPLKRELPPDAEDLPAPPEGFQRPSLKRHIGYLTGTHREPKVAKASKLMGGITVRHIEKGNPVYVRPAANEAGYMWSQGDNGRKVSHDNVELLPSLNEPHAYENLINELLEEYQGIMTQETEDCTTRFKEWRISRRKAELKLVELCVERKMWHLFDKKWVHSGAFNDDGMAALSQLVVVDNRREAKENTFPMEYTGKPVSHYDMSKIKSGVMTRLQEISGVKITRTNVASLWEVAEIYVKRHRATKVQAWKDGGRKGRRPHDFSHVKDPIQRAALELVDEQDLFRRTQDATRLFVKKLEKKPTGRPKGKKSKPKKKGMESESEEATETDEDHLEGPADEAYIAESESPEQSEVEDWPELLKATPRKSPRKVAVPDIEADAPAKKTGPSIAVRTKAARNSGGAQAFAQAMFDSLYPHGYDRQPTSSVGLLCGVNAVTISIRAVNAAFPDYNLPEPTASDLSKELAHPDNVAAFKKYGLSEVVNNLFVDQVALTWMSWARREHDMQVCLGVFGPHLPPILLGYEDGARVVFIWNDQASQKSKAPLSHFEGIAPRFPEEETTPKPINKTPHKKQAERKETAATPVVELGKLTLNPTVNRRSLTPTRDEMKKTVLRPGFLGDDEKTFGSDETHPGLPLRFPRATTTREVTIVEESKMEWTNLDSRRARYGREARWMLVKSFWKKPAARVKKNIAYPLKDVYVIVDSTAPESSSKPKALRPQHDDMMARGLVYTSLGARHPGYGYQIQNGDPRVLTSEAGTKEEPFPVDDLSSESSTGSSEEENQDDAPDDGATGASHERQESTEKGGTPTEHASEQSSASKAGESEEQTSTVEDRSTFEYGEEWAVENYASLAEGERFKATGVKVIRVFLQHQSANPNSPNFKQPLLSSAFVRVKHDKDGCYTANHVIQEVAACMLRNADGSEHRNFNRGPWEMMTRPQWIKEMMGQQEWWTANDKRVLEVATDVERTFLVRAMEEWIEMEQHVVDDLTERGYRVDKTVPVLKGPTKEGMILVGLRETKSVHDQAAHLCYLKVLMDAEGRYTTSSVKEQRKAAAWLDEDGKPSEFFGMKESRELEWVNPKSWAKVWSEERHGMSWARACRERDEAIANFLKVRAAGTETGATLLISPRKRRRSISPSEDSQASPPKRRIITPKSILKAPKYLSPEDKQALVNELKVPTFKDKLQAAGVDLNDAPKEGRARLSDAEDLPAKRKRKPAGR